MVTLKGMLPDENFACLRAIDKDVCTIMSNICLSSYLRVPTRRLLEDTIGLRNVSQQVACRRGVLQRGCQGGLRTPQEGTAQGARRSQKVLYSKCSLEFVIIWPTA